VIYDADGALLTGTFIDYLCPPRPTPGSRIAHRETPSPSLPSEQRDSVRQHDVAPVAIANAVADAIDSDELECR